MFDFTKERYKQQNSLIKSLFVSVLIHSLLALAFSFQRSPQSVEIKKPTKSTPITIIDRQAELDLGRDSNNSKSAEEIAPQQPKARPPTPKSVEPVKSISASPPQVKTTQTAPINPVPKPVIPLSKIQPSAPPTPKLGSSSALISKQASKNPNVATQPRKKPEIERIIEENEAIKLENSTTLTKPLINKDRKTAISKSDNSASISNTNNALRNNRSENSQEASQDELSEANGDLLQEV